MQFIIGFSKFIGDYSSAKFELSSYIDENGKISDMELYNQAKEHCVTYEQLKHGINGKPGKSDLQIIESAMKGNEGMDACCGLYDDYYYTYK